MNENFYFLEVPFRVTGSVNSPSNFILSTVNARAVLFVFLIACLFYFFHVCWLMIDRSEPEFSCRATFFFIQDVDCYVLSSILFCFNITSCLSVFFPPLFLQCIALWPILPLSLQVLFLLKQFVDQWCPLQRLHGLVGNFGFWIGRRFFDCVWTYFFFTPFTRGVHFLFVVWPDIRHSWFLDVFGVIFDANYALTVFG